MNKEIFKNILSDRNLYLKILKDNPKNYDAILKLGLLDIKENNLLGAKKNFKKLIQLNKVRFEGYLNLSNIYFLESSPFKANNILTNYLEKIGENLEIIHALSINLLNTKNYEELDSHIKKYIKNYNSHILNYLKGYLLIKKNKISDSEQYLKKSIDQSQSFWQSYELLLKQYEKQSRIDDFGKLIKIAKNYFVKNYMFNYYESLYLYRIGEYKKSLKILQNDYIFNKLKEDKNKINLADYYDLLSKVFEKLKFFSESYDFAIKRNQVTLNLSENKKFNKELVLDTIKVYQNFFDKKNKILIKNKFEGLHHSNLVFLIGFPRSGTTLLDTILRSHSNTLVLEEKPYLLNVRHNFYKNYNLNDILSIDEEKKIKLQEEYFSSFNYQNDKIVIDKYPLNLIELGFIKTIFPNSKIILAIRHPLDCIISCVLTSFKINDGMTHFENIHTASFFYNECFKLLMKYFKFYEIEHHIVRYEKVVKEFEKEISKLLKYLNLNFEKGIYEFQNTAKKREKINTPSYSQVVKPIYSSSINRHKNFNIIKNIDTDINYWVEYFSY